KDIVENAVATGEKAKDEGLTWALADADGAVDSNVFLILKVLGFVAWVMSIEVTFDITEEKVSGDDVCEIDMLDTVVSASSVIGKLEELAWILVDFDGVADSTVLLMLEV
ncbi:hypothetical protein SK128_007657, partial [Halocaridina rubra]